MAAQGNLGRLYFHGRGVRRNYGEAAKWFRLAALQGDVGA
jgi:TPR repeat protein